MKPNYCKDKNCQHLKRMYNRKQQQYNGPYRCDLLQGEDSLIRNIESCVEEELRKDQIEFLYQREILDL